MMIPVILSGGSGTRLWPLSRSNFPKQFLSLQGEQTMLQQTLLRLQGMEGIQPPFAICNESHRFIVAEQLREIGIKPGSIMLEPIGRNTAPAITIAALAANSPDAILMVFPADHMIKNIDALHTSLELACEQASAGYLVTFGIKPIAPETGYGYIKTGQNTDESVFSVDAFVEKPTLEKAVSYLESGDYLWNSGIFIFRADRFLEELQRFNPEMLQCCQKAFAGSQTDMDFVRLEKSAFIACPSDSIDYAVMEKTDKALVIPLDAGWNDIGSWSALWEVADKDVDGNVTRGDVMTQAVRNSYIYSENKLVTAIGVKDLIIVDTDDAVMVAAKDQVHQVKEIVCQLNQRARSEADIHRKVFRPWGYYDEIDTGERYKAKRIVVKPGAKLSLQKHHHRAEHWVVVRGTALVTKKNENYLLAENESTYIPLGTLHRLENPGKIPLEMIEVQSGSYLNEDDIVRFDDDYKRREHEN